MGGTGNEFGEVGIDGALLADSGALLKRSPAAACAALMVYPCR